MGFKTNILITGATGFIGSHLVKALLKSNLNVKVNALVRISSDIAKLKSLGGINYLYGDLQDKASLKKAIKGIDVLFHLAGILGKHGLSESMCYAVNVEGTRNLLEVCAGNGQIRQFIYLSSAGVSGPNVENANEGYLPNPSNIYERTKARAESIVFDYYRERDVPVTVLRPEFLYGPGDTHLLGLFKAIKKRMFFLIDGGQSLLHPTYIEDIIQALLACCGNTGTIGETYLIAGERSVTVKEFTGLIAKYLGVKRINRSLSAKTAAFIARVFEFLLPILNIDPPLTLSRVKFFTESRSYDTLKARKGLGLQSFALEEGIKKTIEWYKSKGYL